MVAVVVYKVLKLNGPKTKIGSLSYKDGDTFASFRKFLEGRRIFDFPFQFIDSLTEERMQIAWEDLTLLEDHGGELIVIPMDTLDHLVSDSRPEFTQEGNDNEDEDLGDCTPPILSSNASNSQTVSANTSSEDPCE
ncbi:unnamed protein product [Calypogeia fissa]